MVEGRGSSVPSDKELNLGGLYAVVAATQDKMFLTLHLDI